MDELDCSVTSRVESVTVNEMLLKIITLNCWGLKFVAKHREQRIKAIAQHLKEQDYDLVFLQELWCQADFEHIRTTSGFKYAHYFKTCSITGTSGLAIFSRWQPDNVHFEPFSVNGSPFAVAHGDWYAGKGVAYMRVEMDDFRLHLFCTHLHAQYDENEKVDEMYSIHRICQAYQLGKFINLATETSKIPAKRKDLIVLAGDLNVGPEEVPFKLLTSMTQLFDSCMHRYSHRVKYSFKGVEDIEIEEDLVTCGHRNNTYTMTSSEKSRKTTQNVDNEKATGKRIDFILYKLLHSNSDSGISLMDEHQHLCLAGRVHSDGKDPVSGLSFSDHQPVIVNLVVKKGRALTICENKDNASSGSDSKNGYVKIHSIAGDQIFKENQSTSDMADSISDSSMEELPIDEDECHGLTNIKQGRQSNGKIKLDIRPGRRASFGDPTVSVETILLTKDQMSNHETGNGQLKNCCDLLHKYLEDSSVGKHRCYFSILLLVMVLIVVAIATRYLAQTSMATLFHWWLISIGIGALLVVVTELCYRLEHTAVKAIAEEMTCMLSICGDDQAKSGIRRSVK